MKNKIFRLIILLSLLSVTSCAKNSIDDPLIIPPNFNLVPTKEDEKKADEASEVEESQETQELKDLLLN